MVNNNISRKEELTLDSQLKKYAIRSFRGFNSVLVFGLGRRLGIFDYLAEKTETIKKVDNITIVSFNFDDITRDLKLDPNYFEGWLHMALESGIFELDESCERSFRTTPFIFDILVDKNGDFYIGNLIAWMYYNALFQDEVFKRFHTGETINLNDLPPEWINDFQKMSGQQGTSLEKIFATNFKDYKKKLRKGGKILEVGCGYGYNLKGWAKKYKNVEIIGLDIDENAIHYAIELVKNNQWEDRIQIVKSSIEEFAKMHPKEFDLILLNQVLHEMEGNDTIRKTILDNLYILLKDDGKVIVGESMIPSVFISKKSFLFYEIVHKWFEILFGSRFYDENQFREFISATLFKKVDMFKRGTDYVWILQK